MTFNIHHGEGTDGKLNLARIAGVIDSQDAHVVGLQEVDRHSSERSNFVDQASWLAQRLRMHVVYGANLDLDPFHAGQPRRQYGTAILSRSRILDWDNTLLPRFDEHEQRGLLRAHIRVRGYSLQVYNTHLQHGDAAERLAQTRAIKALIGQPSESMVLLGDLNATTQAPEIRTLTEDLADAWVRAGVSDGHTYDSTNPTRRIDYVLTSTNVITCAAAVVSTNPTAADHLPSPRGFSCPAPATAATRPPPLTAVPDSPPRDSRLAWLADYPAPQPPFQLPVVGLNPVVGIPVGPVSRGRD